MSLRWYHHLLAAVLALLWITGLLELTVYLHKRILLPKKEFKRKIPPAFATIRKPPPPREQSPVKRTSAPRSSTPVSLLPALKLNSPVPLPNVAPTQTQWGQGLMHPGGSGAGSGGSGGKARKTLILTEDLVDKSPRLILQVPPVYPAYAEAQNIEGEVFVRLLVGTNGRVERVKILKARPSGIFETAARQAVRKWRFKPGRFRGRTVRTWVRQRITFQLK